MATHSDAGPRQPAQNGTPSTPVGANPAQGRLVEYEQFIESQLRKTRSHVRSVDLAGGLMTLAACSLAYFFLAAMIDHWVIRGGLGFWGRLMFLAVYVVAALYYLATQVLPLVLRRINPVYAAHTIERSRPTLKNALVNFLMFRANPAGLSNAVYEAIEEQAATNLAKVQVDVAVDRSKLIRVGYALLGILFVCALYTLLSPKNLLQTFGRVAMPWADISVPTRTAIEEIEPGDAQVFRGQQATVSARIQGQGGDGKVTLYYSTADGQVTDRAVEMTLPPDGYKHACVLPASDASLQQSLTYRITAGDAVSKTYHLDVVAAPTIVVQSVEYKYPSYTGLMPRRVERQGDIKAIEGTDVTIHALANQDIQSATIDFDCNQTLDQRMQADKQTALATFRLALKDDRQTPEHNCYQLTFKNGQGQQSPQSVRHEIEVTRDVSPEIQFLAPKQDDIKLPENAALDLEIVARNPDFGLRRVKLSAASGKDPLFDKLLLDEVWRGQWVKKFRFEPRKLGLKAGAVVEYMAVAEDNKDPRPNHVETPKRRIRIVSPSASQPQDQVADRGEQGEGQQGKGGSKGDGGEQGTGEHPRNSDERGKDERAHDKRPTGENADKPSETASDDPNAERPEGAQGEQSQGEAGKGQEQGAGAHESGGQRGSGAGDAKGSQPGEEKSGVPADGSDDGDAFERILKHRDQQEKSPDKAADKHDPAGKQDANQRQPKQESGSKAGQDSGDQKQQSGQKPSESQKQQGDPAGKQKQDSSDGQNKKQDQRDQSPDAGGEKNAEKPNPKSSQEKSAKGDKSQAQQKSQDQQGEQGQQGAKEQQGADKGDQAGGGSGDQQGQGKQGQDQQGQGKQGKGQQGQGAGQEQNGKQGSGANSKGRQPQPGQGQGEQPGQGKESDAQDSSTQGGKGKQSASKQTQPKPGEHPQGDEAAEGDDGKPQGEGTPVDKPAGTKNPPSADANDKSRGQSNGEKSQGQPDANERQPSDKRSTDARDNHTPDNSDPAGDAKSGQGAQSKGDPTEQEKQKSSHDKQKPDARGGDGEKEKGESGAGQAGDDNKGSPSPDDSSQPRKNSQRDTPDDKDPRKDDAAQSPSNSQRESDSQGADDGDRSGGGKQGGGQKANKSGTGGPGQNTAADEGAGRSDEAGQGETSSRAGSDRQAGKPTGKSGSEAGKGSKTKPATGEDGKPGPGQAPQNTSSQSQPGQPSSDQSQPGKNGSQASSQPTGGQPGQSQPSEQPWRAGTEEADAANLEYARKSTDLALDYLKDQLRKDKPDAELLDRLGWSQQDLENFVKRWDQMRKQAQSPGKDGTAVRELDDSLRSLGLRPRGTSVKHSAARDDQSQGYKESRRSSPPSEYADQVKAYTQGTARAKSGK